MCIREIISFIILVFVFRRKWTFSIHWRFQCDKNNTKAM